MCPLLNVSGLERFNHSLAKKKGTFIYGVLTFIPKPLILFLRYRMNTKPGEIFLLLIFLLGDRSANVCQAPSMYKTPSNYNSFKLSTIVYFKMILLG